MTVVSDIFDALDSLLDSTLSDYQEFPNPYALESNADRILKKGYGFAYGPGTNSNRLVGCKHTFVQEFIVVLTNEINTTDHNLSAFKNIQKAIMEDVNSVFLAIENDEDINGTAVKAIYTSHGGLEIPEGDRDRYLSVEMSVEVEFFQNRS